MTSLSTTSFSWLHLTDLHLGQPDGDLWSTIKREFYRDLEELHQRCGPWDLILFTGDITYNGRPKQYKDFDEILKDMQDRLGNMHERQFKCPLKRAPLFLAVPGNHDLVRPDPSHQTVKLLQRWWEEDDVQRDVWKKMQSPYYKKIAKVFENYHKWWQPHVTGVTEYKAGWLPGDFTASIEKNGARLGILGLNTAFLQLCDVSYEGKLALSYKQFIAACPDNMDIEAWINSHNACLLLTHHPKSWLHERSRDDLNGIILAYGNFALHLCGHKHTPELQELRGGDRETRRFFQGSSLFGRKHYGKDLQRIHGYSAGRIELKFRDAVGEITLWPRKAERHDSQFNLGPDRSEIQIRDECYNMGSFTLRKPHLEGHPLGSPTNDIKPTDSQAGDYDTEEARPMAAPTSRDIIKLDQAVFHDTDYENPQTGLTMRRDFFGRQAEKARILSLIRTPEHRKPVVVQGERRMGKTSMLRLIGEALRTQDGDTAVVPPLIEVHKFRKASDLFATIVARLATEIGIPGPDGDAASAPLDSDRTVATLQGFLTHAPGKSVVFILDELDECLESRETPDSERAEILDFFSRVSGLPDLRVKFLVSIIRIPARFRDRQTETFIENTGPVYLKPFDQNDPEFEAMISMVPALADPGRRSPADLDLIQRQSGSWPFFAKVILEYLLDTPLNQGLNGPLELLYRQVPGKLSLTSAMSHVYTQHFDAYEKRLVEILAMRGPVAVRDLGRESLDLLDAYHRLNERHYVTRRGDDISFKVKLLGPWFRHWKASGIVPPSASEPLPTLKQFRVALAFPEKHRDYVRAVVAALRVHFHEWQILFDEFLQEDLARADRDAHLMTLYRKHSELTVVFLSEGYDTQRWSGLQWQTIADLFAHPTASLMPARFDSTELPGLWRGGYLELKEISAAECARMIRRRYERSGSAA